MRYKRCVLLQPISDKIAEAYIREDRAILGNKIKLKEKGITWEIKQIYPYSVTKEFLESEQVKKYTKKVEQLKTDE